MPVTSPQLDGLARHSHVRAPASLLTPFKSRCSLSLRMEAAPPLLYPLGVKHNPLGEIPQAPHRQTAPSIPSGACWSFWHRRRDQGGQWPSTPEGRTSTGPCSRGLLSPPCLAPWASGQHPSSPSCFPAVSVYSPHATVSAARQVMGIWRNCHSER